MPQDQLQEQQFILAVKRLSDSLVYGSDPSPYRGSGVDYAQSRLYSSGDPVKSIDWRVTARAGRVYVKEFESPKHVPMWLVLDQSLSMGVTSCRKSKWDWAILLAGGLALAGVNRSSPVGMITTGHIESTTCQPIRHEPSLSREPIYHWLCELRNLVPESRSRVQIRRTLLELEVAVRERSLIILLSDLHESEVLPVIKRLGQRHDVIALRLQDPSEAHPPMRGFFRGVESETGRWFTARGRSFESDISVVDSELRGAGIDPFTLRLDNDFLPGLREFLKNRNCIRRGGPR